MYGYEDFGSGRVTISWGIDAKFEPRVLDSKEKIFEYLNQRFPPDKS